MFPSVGRRAASVRPVGRAVRLFPASASRAGTWGRHAASPYLSEKMPKKWVIKIEIEQCGEAFRDGRPVGPGAGVPLPDSPAALRELVEWCEAARPARQEAGRGECADFFALASEEVRRLREGGRLTTAGNYETAFRSLRKFTGRAALPLAEVDAALLSAYQRWLTARSVCLNSVSNYMRVLRAVYNRAVRAGLAEQRSPFAAVYTGVGPTAKRAIGMSGLRRLCGLALPPGSQMELARDLFMFSFYTRGMPYVDIAFLTPAQIEGDVLTYVRRKTGRTFRVKLERRPLELLRRYARPGAAYAFPVLTATAEREAVRQYRERSCYHNRLLKRLGALAGLDMPLSFYAARHTWASAAFRSGIGMETISRALGHGSAKVTRVYIRGLEDDRAVDRANALVLRRLSG